jgi:small neutral amino acid transporter SnatA (MarC family)
MKMITPRFIFTIFMLTLGPIKTVPAFFAMIEDQPPAATRVLALKGAAAATAVSLVIALAMTGVAGVVASLARRFAPRGRHSVVRRPRAM